MKATDFRPEHFEKGRSFSRTDFAAYVEASDNLTRTLYTRYLPSALGGVVLGLLCSKGLGGFTGNILALVCIFGGLILGAVFNAQAAKPVNELARRLGITRADVTQARKHVKNGTVAWGVASDGFAVPDSRFSQDDRFTPIPPRSVPQQAASALPETPERAVWAAGLLTAGWLLLMLFQIGPLRRLGFSGYGFLLGAGAILGAAVYLIAQQELKWRLFAAGAGLVATFLLNAGLMVPYRLQMMPDRLGLSAFFFFREPPYVRSFNNCLLAVALGLGAALLISIQNKAESRGRMRLCALAMAAVLFLVRLSTQFFNLRMIFHARGVPGKILFGQLLAWMMPCLGPALAAYLVCMAVWYLCRMPHTGVKLRGLGLAWAWLALLGSLVAVVISCRAAVSAHPGDLQIPGISVPFTSQMILSLSALAGYALLLVKRRVGLYVILLGTGLMLGAQILQGLSAIGSRFAWALILPALLGAVNPLLAWLAVRAGETPEE